LLIEKRVKVMSLTNFAALTAEQKTAWSKDFWKAARNLSMMNQFAGSGANSMVQRVTELKKSEKGARAVITLIPDLEGDGIVGDYDLEGNEEALGLSEEVIQLDQLRNANRLAGRMADQKSVVNFREQSRDKLAYWIADRTDQLAFLTMSGVAYTTKTNGALRPVLAAGKNLSDLEYASDVVAPSSARHLRWDASIGTDGGLATGDTTLIAAADTLGYRALVLARAQAKEQYIRGIKGPGGQEIYHVFVTPQTMAMLKLDPDYMQNVRHAYNRGGKNHLFSGTSSVMVDGMVIHEYRHVFNTAGATTGTVTEAGDAGYKWGADADVDGSRVLICGAQALGFADIGDAMWEEDEFDYGNQNGISIGKIGGFLKPQFHSTVTGDDQDFGVLCLDVAQ
jgi:N4-gp56 family major capsid protein